MFDWKVFLWPWENERHKQSKAGLLPKQFHPATVSQWRLTHALNYESNSEAMMLTHNNKYRAAASNLRGKSLVRCGFLLKYILYCRMGRIWVSSCFSSPSFTKSLRFLVSPLLPKWESGKLHKETWQREGMSPDMRCPVRRGVIKGGYSAVFIAS